MKCPCDYYVEDEDAADRGACTCTHTCDDHQDAYGCGIDIDDDVYAPTVIQPRCPHCDSEVWAPAVIEFSMGGATCGHCGVRSKRYSSNEAYMEELEKTRTARELHR